MSDSLTNITADQELAKVKRLIKRSALAQIVTLMEQEQIDLEELSEYMQTELSVGDKFNEHDKNYKYQQRRLEVLKKANEGTKAAAVRRQAKRQRIAEVSDEG